ncbi:hypothetical protein GGD56_000658 [Rhizobium mongolense]|uniref:Uncharacterized protein n=1 Tax=Rhizobium mongolense TaxID=57676 RepID=A0ABR6IG45_9HYPH|nr:hypothetical protein [Rhizobium mongolense]
MVVQQKTGRPVQFEITVDVRVNLLAWLSRAALFPVGAYRRKVTETYFFCYL